MIAVITSSLIKEIRGIAIVRLVSKVRELLNVPVVTSITIFTTIIIVQITFVLLAKRALYNAKVAASMY